MPARVTPMHGTIAGPVVRDMLRAGAAAGLDERRTAAAAGVDAQALDDPEARVPIASFFAIVGDVARAVDDPALPIRMIESRPIEAQGLMGFLVASSTTAREAFTRAIRYAALVSDSGAWRIEDDRGRARVVWRRAGERTLGHRIANEVAIAAFVAGVRQVSDRSFRPLQVRFRHAAPVDTRAHERFFAAPIAWAADEDEFSLPAALLDAMRPTAPNPALAAVLQPQADARLAALAVGESLTSRIEQAIAAELPSGAPGMARLAVRMGVAERTLRRHLDEEGTSFRDTVARVRRQRADALLADGRTPLAQIAFALGFSDQSALSRAYQRWTGAPPSRARRDAERRRR